MKISERQPLLLALQEERSAIITVGKKKNCCLCSSHAKRTAFRVVFAVSTLGLIGGSSFAIGPLMVHGYPTFGALVMFGVACTAAATSFCALPGFIECCLSSFCKQDMPSIDLWGNPIDV